MKTQVGPAFAIEQTFFTKVIKSIASKGEDPYGWKRKPDTDGECSTNHLSARVNRDDHE
jgi:hypothetical protein